MAEAIPRLQLYEALKRGAVCLAATERLAALHASGFCRSMVEGGSKVWRTPALSTFDGWLARLWEKYPAHAPLCPAASSLLLWEKAIQEDADREGIAILDTLAGARLAVEARSLISLYNLPMDNQKEQNEESEAFARWSARVRDNLGARGWADRSDLPELVAGLFKKGVIEPPREICLAGFDEMVPARQRLLKLLSGLGTKVTTLAPHQRKGRAGVYPARDPAAEVKLAALWAQKVLEENPDARVGVVAFNLEEYRPLVERIFAETFSPLQSLSLSEESPSFDLSLGGPLLDEAPVRTALLLLEGTTAPMAIEDWRRLANSPFQGWGSAMAGRAGAAALFSRLKKTSFTLTEAVGHLRRLQPGRGQEDFLARLETAATSLGVGKRLPPSHWAQRFAAFLRTSGWRSGVHLTSREFQAVEKFHLALATVASLDHVEGHCTAERARELLQRIALEPFRPKVGDAPIMVLGVLEAAGMDFDRVWVLGASEGKLPPPARANPFIPYPLQIAAGVRQASWEEALARSERVFKRLIECGDEVVLSFPQAVAGIETPPSPFLKGIRTASPEFGRDYAPSTQVRDLARVGLERVAEEPVPLCREEEITGGSALFAYQAQCPFRAFASIRLGVTQETAPSLGIDPGLQGSMLHEALKTLHALFSNRDGILGATSEEWAAAVDCAVAAAQNAPGAAGFSEKIRSIEGGRIRSVLGEWLAREAERPEFEVLEREAVKKLLFGPIPVSLRVDRVDRVEGGSIVIDYKTGSKIPGKSRLMDDRLVEPQLPLYALACPEATGVAYASARRGECGLSGLAASANGAGMSLSADWEAQKKSWREKIELLAKEFAEGRADPDPEGRGRYCLYCAIGPLCRVARKDGEEGEADQ